MNNKFLQLKNRIAGLLQIKDDRIKELETENEKLKAEPKTALNLSVQELKVPAKLGIDGPVEVKNFPAHPKEISINNLPKVQEVEVKNFPKVEYPTEMKISNLKEVQKVEITNQTNPDHMPVWVPEILATFLKGLINGIDKLTNKVFTVKITQPKPLYVIPLDRNGKAYDLNDAKPAQVIVTGPSGGTSTSSASGGAINKATLTVTATGVVLTPTSGKKLRVYGLKFSLSADMTSVGFKWQGGSVFENYLNPKAGGLYGANNHPDYIEAPAVDTPLEIQINGTGQVAVNVDYKEI